MSSSITQSLPRFSLLLTFLLLAQVVAAQQIGPPSTRRCRWVRLLPNRDTTNFSLPDTLTIVPASVTANGRSVGYNPNTDQYRIIRSSRRFPAPDPGQPDIVFQPTGPDSVLVCYRVLPLRLATPVARRPRTLIDSVNFAPRSFGYNDFAVKEQILATPGINKTGSLARGISFGNTQNVFVNSALNLQLEGKLTDQINLTAAISDQNVPFQPEGNTQQLQEFDRLYITLTHPRWSLTAGDVVLRNRPDYFLRFYKNVQGAAVEAKLTQGAGKRSVTTAAAGVAKGKFASIELPPWKMFRAHTVCAARMASSLSWFWLIRRGYTSMVG
ncbi:hypothetical protein H9L05_12285 [Hymenobacter qilianensis]|uniref:Uncharacterized protein n=1 Tax=Hymenobacter qilianensis TaxID=1385715 RepID=A0A7H0GRL6_9BACT|nr:hypothetical protein [Hymenobacter qilianensis]QNP50932.1 hypothetical protein H9L05_12285 [Hymenobacter qilianensis]